MFKAHSDMHYTTSYKPVSRYANLVYIYGIADPRDHLIRYVGKTQCSLWTRLEWHLKRPVNWRMRRWLEELQWLGVRPEIVAIEVCRNSEWEVRESFWIRKLRDSLLNISPGEPAPEKTRPLGKGARQTLRRAKLEAIDVADKSGPVRVLSRDEIRAIYGETVVCPASDAISSMDDLWPPNDQRMTREGSRPCRSITPRS